MLTLDYTNCLADRVGSHGLDPDVLHPSAEVAQAVAPLTRKLQSTRGTGWERWRELPFEPMRSAHLGAVKQLVEKCRGRFDTMVVLGIGGSALGNIALQSALNSPMYNMLPAQSAPSSATTSSRGTGVPPVSTTSTSSTRPGPRLFVVDNVDPVSFAAILDFCESQPGGLSRTIFNVVSKSGETAETASQFMVIRDALKKALGNAYASNIVAITDPVKGTMRQICDAEKYATLPVPDGVGGRFSVLSPVGLFSAAMCGIDIEALLNGAADMDKRCTAENLSHNPAAMLAFLLVELGTSKGKTNHVLMPYANQLYLLADWYRQLWAESLGKARDTRGDFVNTGFTPIKALGATDQHSQIQLYREGPNDKVIGFVEVEEFSRDVAIPSGLGVEATKYLEGKTMAALLNAEKRATEFACTESQRPNYTIRFPRVDAHHVGQFIQLWQVATAYAGLMLGIDAYDQPAVELGKQATFALMGRAGFEDFKSKVDAAMGRGRKTV